jgi:hypothetical protein
MKNWILLLAMIVVLLLTMDKTKACDWSSIEKQGDRFVYSKDCHLAVGTMVKNEKIQAERVDLLNKSLELKDLALDKADQRINNWRTEAYKQNEKLLDIQRKTKYNDYMVFGLGVVTAILTGYVFNQATK